MRSLTFYEADGATPITGVEALGDIVAGAAFAPVKIGMRNDGDEDFPTTISLEAEGTSDGVGMAKISADTATLSPPWGLEGAGSAPAAGGTWGTTGTYYAVVTRVNATGETVASVEGNATITNTTQKITWSWEDDQPLGVDTYRVYRSTTSGTYASPSRIASGLTVTTFVDDGTAPSAFAPPTENTTGGAAPEYGTSPTMGLGPVVLASALVPGQWAFVWVGVVVPTGTTDDANTRFFAWAFA
jgi:hypothetical protein